MSLPSPLPDDPRKWDGWNRYGSADLYERLCLSFESHPSDELIEEHSRQLLVWWQKKLPLKSQLGNPIAQLLRGGLDAAPRQIAQARTELLNPERRAVIDAALAEGRRQGALAEFKKFLDFALADKVLTGSAEDHLFKLGRSLGLRGEDMAATIHEALATAGAIREADLPPAKAAAPAAEPEDAFVSRQGTGRVARERSGVGERRDPLTDNAAASRAYAALPVEVISDPTGHAAHRPASRSQTIEEASPFATGESGSPMPPVARRVQFPPAEEQRRFPAFESSIGAQMLLIPTGSFLMGSLTPDAPLDELPATQVTLRRYYISRHPVTNEQYELFDPAHVTRRGPRADERHPAVYVSHFDAVRFCEWLSAREGKPYRLPTEAEWEYAARGTDGRIYPWAKSMKSSLARFTSPAGAGNGGGEPGGTVGQGKLANFADANTTFPWRDANVDDGYAETSPVGNYPLGASPFGVEDLSGNVWEWCHDFYDTYKGAERMNPRGPQTGSQRVCRGGSWKSRFFCLKTTSRGHNLPSHASNDVGFRVVCECP